MIKIDYKYINDLWYINWNIILPVIKINKTIYPLVK